MKKCNCRRGFHATCPIHNPHNRPRVSWHSHGDHGAHFSIIHHGTTIIVRGAQAFRDAIDSAHTIATYRPWDHHNSIHALPGFTPNEKGEIWIETYTPKHREIYAEWKASQP